MTHRCDPHVPRRHAMAGRVTGARSFISAAFAILLTYFPFGTSPELKAETVPHPELRRVGPVTQLYVSGKPFLALGGELGNSTASDLAVLDSGACKVPADELEYDHAPGLLGSD